MECMVAVAGKVSWDGSEIPLWQHLKRRVGSTALPLTEGGLITEMSACGKRGNWPFRGRRVFTKAVIGCGTYNIKANRSSPWAIFQAGWLRVYVLWRHRYECICGWWAHISKSEGKDLTTKSNKTVKFVYMQHCSYLYLFFFWLRLYKIDILWLTGLFKNSTLQSMFVSKTYWVKRYMGWIQGNKIIYTDIPHWPITITIYLMRSEYGILHVKLHNANNKNLIEFNLVPHNSLTGTQSKFGLNWSRKKMIRKRELLENNDFMYIYKHNKKNIYI